MTQPKPMTPDEQLKAKSFTKVYTDIYGHSNRQKHVHLDDALAAIQAERERIVKWVDEKIDHFEKSREEFQDGRIQRSVCNGAIFAFKDVKHAIQGGE